MSIKLHLSHGHLEMARCVSKSLEEIVGSSNEDLNTTTIFILYSTVIIHSYLAIESFANKQLQMSLTMPVCRELFVQEFGEGEVGEKLRNKELKDRIKSLCRILGYTPINASSKLWTNFCQLLRDARHFTVHTSVSPTEFNEKTIIFIRNTPPSIYPETAADIIKHFYSQEPGRKQPEWLTENTFFNCKGFELL